MKKHKCCMERGLKAVIFDMDGVIVDSMPYHFIAWFEALKPYGVRVSCFDVYCREGERWDKSLQDFFSQSGRKPSKKLLEEVFVLRRKIFRRYAGITLFNGVVDSLKLLKNKGYLLALVSGTPLREIKHILPKDVYRLFDSVVAGDQVRRGKPHPEPYLKCLKQLRLLPAECLVVENAPLGVESAKAAGIFCVGITTSLPASYLCKADIILDSIDGVIPIVEEKTLPRCACGKI